MKNNSKSISDYINFKYKRKSFETIIELITVNNQMSVLDTSFEYEMPDTPLIRLGSLEESTESVDPDFAFLDDALLNGAEIFRRESMDVLDKTYSEKISEKKSGIQCAVCGKSFKTRSAKQYHKVQYAKGEGCNVPSKIGRPKKLRLTAGASTETACTDSTFDLEMPVSMLKQRRAKVILPVTDGLSEATKADDPFFYRMSSVLSSKRMRA